MMFSINAENLKKLKYIFFEKASSLFIVYSKCTYEYEKIFKEGKNQLKY